jgi:hypothetical protein
MILSLSCILKTTDRKEDIIHCLNKDLNIFWEKKFSDVHIQNSENDRNVFAINEKYILFPSNNTIIVLDRQNGNFVKKIKIKPQSMMDFFNDVWKKK